METPRAGEIWETKEGYTVGLAEDEDGDLFAFVGNGCDQIWWNKDGSMLHPLLGPESKIGPLIRRIHLSPESTKQTDPSPFWVMPEERRAVIAALSGFILTAYEYEGLPVLNGVLDRFTDPRNQESE